MKTMLIIEDDPTLLRGLRDNFECRDFRVQTASDGNEALQKAEHDDLDVILLDIMLPEINGYEICRKLRQSGSTTPIVMLTAKGQEDDIIRGLELGADDYVTKPFSIRELIARVQALLRRSDAENDVMHFGNCAYDTKAKVLRKDGQPVQLTTKERRLLSLFLKYPGRALTRNEILARVWGRGAIVTTRSVDRCVTTLRAKVEPDSASPKFIVTMRDVGYRFQLPETRTNEQSL